MTPADAGADNAGVRVPPPLICLATFGVGWLIQREAPRPIIAAASWFTASGVIGLFLAGHQGGLAPLVVGGPFIIGHFAIAWTLTTNEGSCRANR